MLQRWFVAAVCGVLLVVTPAALAVPPAGDEVVKQKLGAHHVGQGGGQGSSDGSGTRNFRVLGHNDLGLSESNGDVWVHGNFAYVGTWADPCNGRGVKILDVSDLSEIHNSSGRSRPERARAPRTWSSAGSRLRSSAET